MAETLEKQRVNQKIVTAMDGRSNKWLKEKLLDKGIELSDASVSQRLSGLVEWKGSEVLACFEILNIIESVQQ